MVTFDTGEKDVTTKLPFVLDDRQQFLQLLSIYLITKLFAGLSNGLAVASLRLIVHRLTCMPRAWILAPNKNLLPYMSGILTVNLRVLLFVLICKAEIINSILTVNGQQLPYLWQIGSVFLQNQSGKTMNLRTETNLKGLAILGNNYDVPDPEYGIAKIF